MERTQVGRFRIEVRFRARAKDRGVDQPRPAIPGELRPAQAVYHRIDGDRVGLPGHVKVCPRFQPLDRAAACRFVEVESACQCNLRSAVAVDVLDGQIDVLLRSCHGPPFPSRVLVPVHTVGFGRKRDDVGPAVSIEIGDRHLVARRERIDLVSLEANRRRGHDKECGNHRGVHGNRQSAVELEKGELYGAGYHLATYPGRGHRDGENVGIDGPHCKCGGWSLTNSTRSAQFDWGAADGVLQGQRREDSVRDPVRHVVVDANVLSAFLYPGSMANAKTRERSRILLGAALAAKWPGLRIYTPGICIAASMCVLDKYRFCTWHGPAKLDASKQMAASDYEASRNLLADAVQKRVIEQVQYEPGHVLLAGLVSPINHRYQIRRKRRARGDRRVADPVTHGGRGLPDCRRGHPIGQPNGQRRRAPGDRRPASCRRAWKSSPAQTGRAESLGLTKAAEQVGLTWSRDLYPRVVSLQRASDQELKIAFGGWPLPTIPLCNKCHKDLSEIEARHLVDVWLRVATERGISNPETLPYSREIEDIKARFALESSVFLDNRDIFLFLAGKRKANELPRPGEADAPMGDAVGQMKLFE